MSEPSTRAARLRAELFADDLCVADLAHILDLDETTVRRRLSDGTLPGYRLGREWRTTEESLRRYVAQLKSGGRPASGSASLTWPSGWPPGITVPSVTHPIGTTVTYNSAAVEPLEHDEP